MNLHNAINICINQLLNKFESCKLVPYLCPAGKPTIGWGNTFYAHGIPVTMDDPKITQDEADNLRNNIVTIFAHQVSLLVVSDITDNQGAALIAITYNIGINAFKASHLLTMVNYAPNNLHIDMEFMRWIYVGGVVCSGLKNRRQAEINLYFS